MSEPSWLARARREVGVREYAGAADNPRVLSYYREVGHGWVDHDETAWCAAFVGAILEREGIRSSRSLRARSYLSWGVRTDEPRVGAIAVLSRGSNPAHGHVGFVVGSSAREISLLGGNQSNAVNIRRYARSRVLAYRWPDERPARSIAGSRAGNHPAELDTTDARLQSQFDACLAHVLDVEGGWSNHPRDPGGATNFGITLATYAAHLGKKLSSANRSALTRALRSISPDVVREIYFQRYWKPSRAGDLPAGVDLFHFDCSVNQGVGRASRLLQEACGSEVDGEIGPFTLAAVGRMPVDRLVREYYALRLAHYRSLPTFDVFGRGWQSRIKKIQLASLALASRALEKQQKEKNTVTDETKWWGRSLTIWGAIVSALATLAPVLSSVSGIEISPEFVRQVGTHVTQIVQAIAGLAGLVMTVWGRMRAETLLTRRNVMLRL